MSEGSGSPRAPAPHGPPPGRRRRDGSPCPVPPRRRLRAGDRAARPVRTNARRGAVGAFRLPLAGAGQVRARRPFPADPRGPPLPRRRVGNRRHLAPHRPGRRVAGRLPRRRRRPDLHRRLRRPAGVPGDPARHRDRRRARPLVRKRPVRAFGPRVGGVRPGDPRPGALRENEGVRRVGPGRGRLPGAPAPAPHPPQRDLPDPRGGDLRDRPRHRRGGGALFPGPGRRAAGGVVGVDDRRGPALPVHRAAPGDGPRSGDPSHGDGVQLRRGRAAGRPRRDHDRTRTSRNGGRRPIPGPTYSTCGRDCGSTTGGRSPPPTCGTRSRGSSTPRTGPPTGDCIDTSPRSRPPTRGPSSSASPSRSPRSSPRWCAASSPPEARRAATFRPWGRAPTGSTTSPPTARRSFRRTTGITAVRPRSGR